MDSSENIETASKPPSALSSQQQQQQEQIEEANQEEQDQDQTEQQTDLVVGEDNGANEDEATTRPPTQQQQQQQQEGGGEETHNAPEIQVQDAQSHHDDDGGERGVSEQHDNDDNKDEEGNTNNTADGQLFPTTPQRGQGSTELSQSASPYGGTGETPVGGRLFEPSQLDLQEIDDEQATPAMHDTPSELDGQQQSETPLVAPEVFPGVTPRGGEEDEEGDVIAPLHHSAAPRRTRHLSGPLPTKLISSEEAEFRAKLIEAYQAAMQERMSLESRISIAQHSVAEILKKKQKDDKREERDRGVENHEERYSKYLTSMSELAQERKSTAEAHAQRIAAMQQDLQEREARTRTITSEFNEKKLATAQSAVSQRTGRPLAPSYIKELLAREISKEEEVQRSRLAHLRLVHALHSAEESLKQGEQLGEGLHLIDFEQLKLENQTFNEKIEERNEDVIKLRAKIANTVNVLSHVREVLQFTEEENASLQAQLRAVESQAAQQRDVLSRTKRSRDKLRADITKLHMQAGLSGDTLLLRDMERTYDSASDLRAQLQDLKSQHAALHSQIKQLQGARLSAKPHLAPLMSTMH